MPNAFFWAKRWGKAIQPSSLPLFSLYFLSWRIHSQAIRWGRPHGLSTLAVGEGQKLQGQEQSVRVQVGREGSQPPPPHTHRRSATWGCQVRRVFTCGGRPALCVWAHRKWRAASTVRDKADEEGAQCKVFGEDIRTQAGWGEATQTSNPAEGTEPQPSVRPHRGDRGREEISVMFREQDQTSNHIKDNGSQVSHRQRRNLQMQTPWCWCWMRIRGMEVNSWFSTWKLTVEIKTARVSAVGMCVCMCVTPWKNGSFPAGAGKNKTSLEHLTLGNTALEEWRRHGKRHRLPTWRASADQIEEQLN